MGFGLLGCGGCGIVGGRACKFGYGVGGRVGYGGLWLQGGGGEVEINRYFVNGVRGWLCMVCRYCVDG